MADADPNRESSPRSRSVGRALAPLWASLGGALLVLVAVELLLRALPAPTSGLADYRLDPNVLSYPPGHRWQAATGWDLRNAHELRANNLGFASEIDFVPDPRAVALIGDSFIEASMLPPGDRPGPRLLAWLGGATPVYPMGGPGSSLLDYVERVRLASTTLEVRSFVLLLEGFDVRQALCGSGNVHAACIDRQSLQPRLQRQEQPGPWARVARESALARYYYGQLRVRPAGLVDATFRRAVPEHPKPRDEGRQDAPEVPDPPPYVDVIVDLFLQRMSEIRIDRLVVVVDGTRGPQRILTPPIVAERRRLIARLREAGIQVIDAEPLFVKHLTTSARSVDVGPYDGHLNKIGVDLLMRAAAEALAGKRP